MGTDRHKPGRQGPLGTVVNPYVEVPDDLLTIVRNVHLPDPEGPVQYGEPIQTNDVRPISAPGWGWSRRGPWMAWHALPRVNPLSLDRVALVGSREVRHQSVCPVVPDIALLLADYLVVLDVIRQDRHAADLDS